MSAGGERLDLALKLHVFAFSLPRRGHLATPFGCNPETLSQWYAGNADYRTHLPVETWKRWNRFLLDYRITPTHVGQAYRKETRRPDGSLAYDYTITDECLRDVLDRLPENGISIAGLGTLGWTSNGGATLAPVAGGAGEGGRAGQVSWPRTDAWAALDRFMPGSVLADRKCRAFRFRVKAEDAADAERSVVAFVNCFPNRWVTTFRVGGTDWHEVRLPLEQYHHNTSGEPLTLEGLRTCSDFQFVISKQDRPLRYRIDDIRAECEGGDLVIDDFEEATQARELRESLGRQVAHFRERGWLKWGHVYARDEIRPEEYAQLLPAYRRAKEAVPDAPLMQTYYVNRTPSELVGPVRIWCAITSIYDEGFLSARRKAGEKSWLYVCCGPGLPYANFFIDQPGIDHRALFWQTWQRSARACCTGRPTTGTG